MFPGQLFATDPMNLKEQLVCVEKVVYTARSLSILVIFGMDESQTQETREPYTGQIETKRARSSSNSFLPARLTLDTSRARFKNSLQMDLICFDQTSRTNERRDRDKNKREISYRHDNKDPFDSVRHVSGPTLCD